MKQLILLAVGCLSMMQLVHAQNPDQRIVEALGQQAAQGLSQDSLDYYVYILENGVELFQNVPDKKIIGLAKLSELEYVNGEKPFKTFSDDEFASFNRLRVTGPSDERFSQLFLVDGTNNVLMLKPLFELKQSYKYSHAE